MDEEQQPPTAGAGPSTAAQVVGSTVAALAALTPIGGVGAAALTPWLITTAQKALDETRGRSTNSVAMLLQHSAMRLQIEPDEVQSRANTTPDGEALFVDSVTAASQTIDQRKIAALAKALANGLGGDQAKIDEERLIVRALAQLEAPHIRVLAALRSQPSTGPKPTATRVQGAIIATLHAEGLAVDDTREMAKAADQQMAKQVFEAMKHMAKLQDARQRGRPDPPMPVPPSDLQRWRRQQDEREQLRPRWRRTPFGDECLAHLWSAADEAGLPTADLDHAGRHR